MAERRMFAKSVVMSDAFLDMPFSTRCLYFALGMYADDDGFVDSPKSVMRQTDTTQADLTTLIDSGFVIPFETGVIVITHWNVNNNLRKDRHKPTLHATEYDVLSVENGVYIRRKMDCQPNDNQVTTNCQPNDNQVPPFGCIGKGSIGKESKGEYRQGEASAPACTCAPARESFCTTYGIAANAEPPPDMDFDKLSAAYSESKFLQDPNKTHFHSMRWIIKHYNEIIEGKYADFTTIKAKPASQGITNGNQSAGQAADLFTVVSEDDNE